MTTYPTDFIRIETTMMGQVNVPLNRFGFEWPPPERIFFDADGVVREATDGDPEAFIQVREAMSELSDEAADHPNVMRGATYRYLHPTQTPAENS